MTYSSYSTLPCFCVVRPVEIPYITWMLTDIDEGKKVIYHVAINYECN